MKCLVLLAVVSLGLPPSAQTGGSAEQQNSRPPGNISTPLQILVTGCLKRASDGGYYITDRNGTTWELVAGDSSIDLARHIFHTVSITGKHASPAKQQGGNNESQRTGTGAPHSTLRVLSLQVLSPSCTR